MDGVLVRATELGFAEPASVDAEALEERDSVEFSELLRTAAGLNAQLDQAEAELKDHENFSGTRDMVSATELGLKVDLVSEVCQYVRRLLEGKQRLLSHIQKPFTSESIVLEAGLHGDFVALLKRMRQQVFLFESSCVAADIVPSISVASDNVSDIMKSLTSFQAKCQRYHEALLKTREAFHKKIQSQLGCCVCDYTIFTKHLSGLRTEERKTKLVLSQSIMKAGALKNPQNADRDVQDIVSQVKAEVETRTGQTYQSFDAVTYASQTVAGTNYFVKVSVDDGEFLHLRIFVSLQRAVSLHSVQMSRTEADPLVYFQADLLTKVVSDKQEAEAETEAADVVPAGGHVTINEPAALPSRKLGGLGETKPADAHVQSLVDNHREEVAALTRRTLTTWRATNYASQVVAGTNYFVKVDSGNDAFVHLRIYRDFQGNTKLRAIETGHTATDAITYFQESRIEQAPIQCGTPNGSAAAPPSEPFVCSKCGKEEKQKEEKQCETKCAKKGKKCSKKNSKKDSKKSGKKNKKKNKKAGKKNKKKGGKKKGKKGKK